MTALISKIVARLRDTVPEFNRNVFATVTLGVGEHYTRVTRPFCLVTLFSETSEDVDPSKLTVGTSFQDIVCTKYYAFGVIVDTSSSLRGEEGPILVETLIEKMVYSLVNWVPDENYGPTQYIATNVGEGSQTQALYVVSFAFHRWMVLDCDTSFDESAEEGVVQKINVTGTVDIY